MKQYIDKSTLIAEIERRMNEEVNYDEDSKDFASYADFTHYSTLDTLLDFLDTLEVKEMDSYNNGWIDCTKQMPQETKQTSDTLQGHREWTESDMVLVWDSMYGCGIDSTRNGKWRREQKGGYTGQVVHGIIAWRPIPEFNEEFL